jgi:hypothetical protein
MDHVVHPPASCMCWWQYTICEVLQVCKLPGILTPVTPVVTPQDLASVPSLPAALTAQSPKFVTGGVDSLTSKSSTLKVAMAWSPCASSRFHGTCTAVLLVPSISVVLVRCTISCCIAGSPCASRRFHTCTCNACTGYTTSVHACISFRRM